MLGGIGAGGEEDDRGWDGWMASPTQWTWVWVNSGSWWWTGRPGVLRFVGSQRVGHDWVIELNWTLKAIDFKKSRLPCIMWVGLIQSVEGLKRKRLRSLRKREFCLQNAFRLEQQHQFFPGSPACWSTLRFWTCQPHNCVDLSVSLSLTHTLLVLFL